MLEPRYASFWWRWLAAFLDSLILFIPSLMIGLVFGIAMGIAFLGSNLPKEEVDAIAGLSSNLLGIVISWLYHALMESSSLQATLGKKICGIRVTDLDGKQLSFARATGRYFGKIVSTIPCMAGYLMAAFTAKRQALHDLLAGTLVLHGTPSTTDSLAPKDV